MTLILLSPYGCCASQRTRRTSVLMFRMKMTASMSMIEKWGRWNGMTEWNLLVSLLQCRTRNRMPVEDAYALRRAQGLFRDSLIHTVRCTCAHAQHTERETENREKEKGSHAHHSHRTQVCAVVSSSHLLIKSVILLTDRLLAFAKRLCIVSLSLPPHGVLAALHLINRVMVYHDHG